MVNRLQLIGALLLLSGLMGVLIWAVDRGSSHGSESAAGTQDWDAGATHDQDGGPILHGPAPVRQAETFTAGVQFVGLGGAPVAEEILEQVEIRFLTNPGQAVSAVQLRDLGLESSLRDVAFLVSGRSVFPIVVQYDGSEVDEVSVPVIRVGAVRFRVSRNGNPVAGRVIRVEPHADVVRSLVELLRASRFRPLAALASRSSSEKLESHMSAGQWAEVADTLSPAMEAAITSEAGASESDVVIAPVFGLSGDSQMTNTEGLAHFPWLPAAEAYTWRAVPGTPLLDTQAVEGGEASWLDFKPDGSFTARSDRPAIPIGQGAYFHLAPGQEKCTDLEEVATGSISGGWSRLPEDVGGQHASILLSRVLKGPQGQDATAVTIASWSLEFGERFSSPDLLPGEYRLRGSIRGQQEVRILSWSGRLEAGQDLDLGEMGTHEGWSARITVVARSNYGEEVSPAEAFDGDSPALRVRLAARTERVMVAPKLEIDVPVGGAIRVSGLLVPDWWVTGNDRISMRRAKPKLKPGVALRDIGAQREELVEGMSEVGLAVGVELELSEVVLRFESIPPDAKGDYAVSLVQEGEASLYRSIDHRLLDVDGVPRAEGDRVAVKCAPGSYKVFVRLRSQGSEKAAYYAIGSFTHGQENTEVRLRLQRGQDISGKVVDRDGDPVAERALEFFLEGAPDGGVGDPAFIVKSDSNGGFVLRGVPDHLSLLSNEGVIDHLNPSSQGIKVVVGSR